MRREWIVVEHTDVSSRSRIVWRVITAIGLVFFGLGLLDAGLTWLPLHLGESEWELGTTSQFFDTFPFLGLGLSFLLAAAIVMRRRWQVRSIATLCILVAVYMWLAFALYATVLPLAFARVPNPVLLTPMKKAATKTAVEALLYPFALLWLAAAGWRAGIGRKMGS
jgi:hypothetical protein